MQITVFFDGFKALLRKNLLKTILKKSAVLKKIKKILRALFGVKLRKIIKMANNGLIARFFCYFKRKTAPKTHKKRNH